MKKIVIFSLCLLLTGCISFEAGHEQAGLFPYNTQKEQPRGLDNIRIGMSFQEVKDRLQNAEKIIGYDKNTASGEFQKIYIKNPYRTEILKKNDTEYLVNYYFAEVKKPDGIVAEEELMPLIFKDNTLIGKGWDYLFRLKNNN